MPEDGKSLHLNFPEDPRARAHFTDLNGRYFHFASQLPPPLDVLAQTKGTFEGDDDQSPFEGASGLNPVLVATPWLFWETFAHLEDAAFLEISEAGMYFVLASVILDHIIDGQGDSPDVMSLFHQALYEAALRRFRDVFPYQSTFWSHFDRLAFDHLAGLAVETQAQSNPALLNFDCLITMAHGKVSPIVATMAAMAEASDQMKLCASIEASLKYIAVASQMLDDIGDWEHDLGMGHMTYYLTLFVAKEEWESEGQPSVEELQRRINDGWLDVRQLRVVIDWLDQSLDAVSSLNCPAWVEYVNGYRRLADDHATRFTARHLQRVLAPFVPKP